MKIDYNSLDKRGYLSLVKVGKIRTIVYVLVGVVMLIISFVLSQYAGSGAVAFFGVTLPVLIAVLLFAAIVKLWFQIGKAKKFLNKKGF